MKKLIFAFCVGAFLLSCAPNAFAGKYYVYCANGRIEVDSRDPKQMQSARGQNTYVMSEFNYRTDAEKFAKQLGGIGAQCPRR